jgi:hypothetical protein
MGSPRAVEMVFYFCCISTANFLSAFVNGENRNSEANARHSRVVRRLDDERPSLPANRANQSPHTLPCVIMIVKSLVNLGTPKTNGPRSFRRCYYHVIRIHVARLETRILRLPRIWLFISSIWDLLRIMRIIDLSNHLNPAIRFHMNIIDWDVVHVEL